MWQQKFTTAFQFTFRIEGIVVDYRRHQIQSHLRGSRVSVRSEMHEISCTLSSTMPFLWEPRNGYLWYKYIVYSIHYTCMPNSASGSNNNHSLYLRMYCYFTLKYPKEDLLSSWKTANLSCLFCWFLCRIANISFVTSLHFSGGLLNQPVGLVSSAKTFPCADVTRCPLRAAEYLITTAYGLKNEDDVTCRLPEKN